MMASEVLGRDALDAMLAEGKSKEDILSEAKKRLDPVKERLGEDVYRAFSEKGVPFDKMSAYADYEAKKAEEAQKAAAEAARKQKIDRLAKQYEKTYADDSFLGRLKSNALRVGSELDVVTDYFNPFDHSYDPKTVAMLQASDRLNEKYAAAHRDAAQQQAYVEKTKAFEDANTTWDTIRAGADLLGQKVSNPNEWNMAAVSADLLNPINIVSVPAGGVAGAVAEKAAARAAVGAAVGAASEGAINAGYEYGVARGQGKSNAEAKKSAVMGGAFGAAVGVPGGAVGAVLHERWRGGTDDGGGTASKDVRDAPGKKIEIPQELQNSTLLALDEVQDHSAKAEAIIGRISEQASDPAQRDMLVEKHVPPTRAEADFSAIVNDGVPVRARLAGERLRHALEVSMAEGKDTPEVLDRKLKDAGYRDDVRAVVIDSYNKKDLSLLDTFIADKIEQAVKGAEDAVRRDSAGNAGRDTAVQAGGDSAIASDAGAGVGTYAKPEAVPEHPGTGAADAERAGRYAGDDNPETVLPAESEKLAGHTAAGLNDRTVPRTGKEQLVPPEDGVRSEPVAADLASRATGYRGTPYVWGGTDLSSGVDCSSFVQQLHRKEGIALPRTAWQQSQSNLGADVPFSHLKVGDTVFFSPSQTGKHYAPVTHEAIITGFTQDGTPVMTHAKGRKFGVVTEPMSAAYKQRFYNAKRFTQKNREVPAEETALLNAEREEADAASTERTGKADAAAAGASPAEETPAERYDRLRNDPGVSPAEKGRMRKESEDFKLDRMAVSDRVIKRYRDTGFELKSYPARMDVLKALPKETQRGVSVPFARIADDELIDAFGFDRATSTREVSLSAVRHILSTHGDVVGERKRGHLAVTLEDIAAYPDIVAHPDTRIFTERGKHHKFVVSAKQVNGHYVIVEEVSRKKNRLSLKTMYKGKGKLKKDALAAWDREPPLYTSGHVTGYEPIEQMLPLRKSIAKDPKNVKKLSDLTGHRYYDALVEQLKAQKAREDLRPKRQSVQMLKETLEKRGWDKSEDRYRAEMQRLFKKKPKAFFDTGFHSYSKAELSRLEKKAFTKKDVALAKRLKDDLKEYFFNPLFEKDREAIDDGWKIFTDEVDVLRALKADEALGLIESEHYGRGFEEMPTPHELAKKMEAVSVSSDKVLKELASPVNRVKDALYGKAKKIGLSHVAERALEQIEDPVRRTQQRRWFEFDVLKQRVSHARKHGNKNAVARAKNVLKKWQDEHMQDGKMKTIGEEC